MLCVVGERCEFPQRVRPPKGLTLFSALMMASPDIVILWCSDWWGEGARPPCPLLAYGPVYEH